MVKFIITKVIVVLGVMLCPLAKAANSLEPTEDWFSYRWGRGVSVPSANLNVGGYFKGAYEYPENRQQVGSLSDLSVFITWTPQARLRFFAEIEQHNWINSNDGVEPFVDSLNIERLYVDFLVDESWSVRFGKFLTPFGRWNVIHSAPLVWTTNRPIITSDLFSSSYALRANGVMLNYTHIINEHNLDVTVYADNSANLEPKTFNQVTFDQAVGLRVNYEITDAFQIGASYLAYQKLADADFPLHQVWGVDFLWQYQGYEVMMEGLYHIRENVDPSIHLEEKGLYLQGVAPLGNKVFMVGRYEYLNTNVFDERVKPDHNTHIGVAGLAWRPYLPLVIKTEYRFGDNNVIIAPSGFFASIAMFF